MRGFLGIIMFGREIQENKIYRWAAPGSFEATNQNEIIHIQ
jgi:hypothetical protein